MRRLSMVSGIGALTALVVMVVLVARGPGDEAGPAGASSPFAAGSLAVGVQDDQIATVPSDQLPARLDRLVASGVRFTRVDVRWNEIAARAPTNGSDPADPAYVWTRYDAVFDGLLARKIEPIAVFSRSPGWANGGRDAQWAPQVEAYGAFVTAVASRYRGGAHARVRLFEAWDEPNSPTSLLPQWDETRTPATPSSPATYATLLARAGSAIKAVNPDALIIGVSTAHIETSAPPVGGVSVGDFVNALVPLAPAMDAVGFHLEPSGPPNASSQVLPSFATLPRLVAEFDRVAPGAPVLVTRLGYATAPGGLSEVDQAAYLTQALERLAAVPRIRLVMWHALQDSDARQAGLLRADGSEKPSWTTLATGPKSLPSAATP